MSYKTTHRKPRNIMGKTKQNKTLLLAVAVLDDICIISIKEVKGDALTCFRQVNDSDVLVMLELGDYKAVVRQTIQQIQNDFQRISAVFSVNCLFRYLLFTQNNYMQEYLDDMSALGNHAGFVGYGEHYNNRFVNQSMTCVVFE